MSTTDTETTAGASPVAPEVRLFLARVRQELADLDGEEVLEITDGLEADLTELVSERGPSALGNPVEYAGELRAAAGLSPAARARAGRGVRANVTRVLDGVHAKWDALVDRSPRDLGPLLGWLRPLWWVVRAWLAVQLVYVGLFGGGSYPGGTELVPHLRGFGWLLLLGAVVGSVQLGRGRLWPGGRRGLAARLVLLGLNAFAVLVLPLTLSWVGGSGYASYDRGFQDGLSEAQLARSGSGAYGIDEQAGVYSGGRWVSNIYAYDASGKPLVGVQLFDQTGQPIDVVRGPECQDQWDAAGDQPETGWIVIAPEEVGETGSCLDWNGTESQARVSYPWTNGAAQLDNVFPFPTRLQDTFARDANAFVSDTPPTIGEFPFASVPPVSLPGITPGVVEEAGEPAPESTSQPSARPTTRPSASGSTKARR